MRKIKLILGTSNIIPITYNGAENLYQKHFRPFLQLLNKNIDLSFTVYNSGIFYEWLESRHPEFLMLCNDLVKDRNLEILGGAYYEPVFSVIPNKDRVGQIEELTTYLRKKFNRRPRGFWLAEQVWEPNFPSSLATCGMNYLFLDSSFILNAGKKDSELIKCYITEDQGKTIYVFPTHNKLLLKLSQLTPSSAVNKIIEMGNESGNNVIAFIPGGDMFVNNRIKNRISISWFENFLKEIRKKRDQVETIHPSKYLRKYGIFSKVYIPCLNFDEIKKRVVKNSQDRVQKKLDSFFNGSLKELSVGGGFFRDYLSEINESNKLYSKMMFVNVLVNQIRSDRSRKKSAREELWKGQNNYAYWPGSVNGIQNVETRIKAYNSLIEAEKLSREKGIFDSSIMLTDFDMDGQNECIFQGQNINAYIHNFGGCMFELDFLQKPWNYINTFIQDRSRKISRNSDYSFIDYFFSNEENLEDYSKNDIKLFSDFHQSNYTIENFDKEHQEITYRCSGIVKKRNQSWDLIIIKKFKFMKKAVIVNYEIINNSKKVLDDVFACELNFNFEIYKNSLEMQLVSAKKNISLLGTPVRKNGVSEFKVNHYQKKNTFAIQSLRDSELWSVPVYYESNYQYSKFLLKWNTVIQPGDSWKNKITLRFERIKVK